MRLIPQASFLITRMLDEMVALIIGIWEIRDGGVDKLDLTYQGEDPLSKLQFVEKYFDPYKHIQIQEFMVNLGSYLSELIRVFSLDAIGEFKVLNEYLENNVEKIHYMGSVIHRIEEDKKIKIDLSGDFH